jgi:carboxy-terminal domain RNA polymerase II polypeptide A small phosphatase
MIGICVLTFSTCFFFFICIYIYTYQFQFHQFHEKIEDVVHHVYVCKRPGVDEYLRRCGERYEVVIYTASLNKYADPLLDKLDKHGVIRHRLFRESCTQYQGNYVKNLNLLGRDLRTCIIVDNSPLSYLFHPENAVGCISWIDQKDDDELRVIQDFCEVIENEEDIRYHMRHWRQGKDYDVKSAFN